MRLHPMELETIRRMDALCNRLNKPFLTGPQHPWSQEEEGPSEEDYEEEEGEE